jgi:peptidoglycan hydrolase-like protein with peptidoglycan-binding domain
MPITIKIEASFISIELNNMKIKKILIIFGIIIISFIALALLVSYINYSKVKKTNSEVVFKDFFPFGKSSFLNFNKEKLDENTDNKQDENIKDYEPNNKLIRISDEPIAGFEFIQKEYFPDSNVIEKDNNEETVTVSPYGTFEKELKFGSKGEDVKRLQQTLNDCPELGLAQTGPGSKGKETEYFVERTMDAVKRFQTKFKDDILIPQSLKEPTGILDELTRKKLSSPFVCKTTSVILPTTKPGGILKTTIRYIEKNTGNIYDFLPETGETSRLTNQTIPRIQEAFFTNNGENVFIRYLKEDNETIETYFASVPKQILGGDGSAGELKGDFLEKNIISVSTSPDKNTAFLQTTSGQNMLGSLFEAKTKSKKQLFNSSFNEWLSEWVSSENILLTTKPSGFVQGYSYLLNTKSGNLKKIMGNVYGLLVNINSSMDKLLFSTSTERNFIFGLYDLKEDKKYSLNVDTLPDKCTWALGGGTIYCAVPKIIPGGVYPDEWYQGIVSFNDNIVRIDPSLIYDNEILVDPESEGTIVDVDIIKVDDKELYTVLRDKKTGILYMVHN